DADDRELGAVEADGLADRVGAGAELAAPERVADDRDRTAPRDSFVGGGEAAVERGRHAERPEEVAVDEEADRHLRLLVAAAREAERRDLRRGQAVERLRARLDVLDVRVRKPADRVALRQRGEAHDAAGGGDRQRT